MTHRCLALPQLAWENQRGEKKKANDVMCFVFFLLLNEPYAVQGEGWI